MPLVLYQHTCRVVLRVALEENPLCLLLRLVEAVGPAGLGQYEGLDVPITGLFQLLHLVGQRIYLGIGIQPELFNLLWPLLSEPGGVGYGNPSARSQVGFPEIDSLLETNIIDGPF